MAKAKDQFVAKSQQNQIDLFDTRGDTGFENVTAADLLIPRLTILQGLSPQVTQGKPEYDPRARVGMIYDVGLQEGFPDGICILPVHYTKVWLEWAPRASGKGLITTHNSADIVEDATPDKNGRPVLPNGNYIAETAQLFCLNLSADKRKSFIPMTSTQLKKARRLLTLAMSEKIERADKTTFTPPLWYRTYLLTTVPESNAQGSWMGWKIERDLTLPEQPDWRELMADVESFRDALIGGSIKGDMGDGDAEPRAEHRNAQGDPL